MNIQFKIVDNKKEWEQFNLNSAFPSIFQSWAFTEAEKKRGQYIIRFGLYKNNRLTGIAGVFLIKAKRGTFLHIRGGPVLNDWKTDLSHFIAFLKEYYKKENPWFVRISPPILYDDKEAELAFQSISSYDAPIPLLDAETAWILDITKPEDVLLQGMRKTTRYLIKKAGKVNVTTEASTSKEAIDTLLKIYKVMVKEKGIIPHKGIEEEFNEFKKDDNAIIILGKHNKTVLGAALILFYGNEAIYHHSAHLKENGIPVSYLMQWRAIHEAQKRGKKYYNFWGVEPTGNPQHPWYGLSLFKKGFGGGLRQFIRAKDIPFKTQYHITRTIEIVRRIKRYKIM